MRAAGVDGVRKCDLYSRPSAPWASRIGACAGSACVNGRGRGGGWKGESDILNVCMQSDGVRYDIQSIGVRRMSLLCDVGCLLLFVVFLSRSHREGSQTL